jgi:EmrB/QacA subfamily drug resistance transporter
MTITTAPPGAPGRTGTRTIATLVLASLGSFLAALDVVVVAAALPALQQDLGADLADLEWTINAYNLVFACLMLTGAALGDRFGRRRTYTIGLLIFALASAGAALADGPGALIAWRAAQGAGAAILMPLTLTLIVEAFPAGKRGAAIGIWGGVSGLGVAAGPLLGGAVIEGFSWQWIFWINVPLALGVALLTTILLTESRGTRTHLDLVGLLLAALGLFALTWAPVRAPERGWNSPEVVGAFVAGVALLGLFLAWEHRTAHPMLPLAYFRRRGFTTANGVIFAQFVSLIGALFFITQLFQIGLGYSPLEAGLRILVWVAMPMIVSPIAGILSDRIGNKPFMVLGLLLQAAGLGRLALLVEPGVTYGDLVVPLIVAGIGIAMCFPTTANAVTLALPPEDVALAAGTNTALREIGGVFGVAILAAVFAANGGYSTTGTFLAGLQPALLVAAAVPLIGLIPAALAPGRKRAAVQR